MVVNARAMIEEVIGDMRAYNETSTEVVHLQAADHFFGSSGSPINEVWRQSVILGTDFEIGCYRLELVLVEALLSPGLVTCISPTTFAFPGALFLRWRMRRNMNHGYAHAP